MSMFPSAVGQPVPHPVAQKEYLIVTKRYAVHKILGTVYLVFFCVVLTKLALQPLHSYSTSNFWYYPFILHSIGLAQTLSALAAFRFLPRAQRVESFFGDKTTISTAFVKENAFFVTLSLFASLYCAPRGRSIIRRFKIVESVFIFVPYQTVRRCFPKTSFERKNLDKSSSRNVFFFKLSKYVASYFYLFGKHYVGNLLNYAMFLDLDSLSFQGHLYWILLGAGYSLTIGVFLHTLKFRKILGPKTAIGAYLLGYLISGLPTLSLMFGPTLFRVVVNHQRHHHPPHPGACLDARLWALATGGLVVNLLSGGSKMKCLSSASAYRLALVYQLGVGLFLHRERYYMLRLKQQQQPVFAAARDSDSGESPLFHPFFFLGRLLRA